MSNQSSLKYYVYTLHYTFEEGKLMLKIVNSALDPIAKFKRSCSDL